MASTAEPQTTTRPPITPPMMGPLLLLLLAAAGTAPDGCVLVPAAAALLMLLDADGNPGVELSPAVDKDGKVDASVDVGEGLSVGVSDADADAAVPEVAATSAFGEKSKWSVLAVGSHAIYEYVSSTPTVRSAVEQNGAGLAELSL